MRAFSGHKSSSFYIKTALSGDGRHLLSGSSCGRGFLWEVWLALYDDVIDELSNQVARPEAPPLTLCGHSAEVTAVDWSPTLDKVHTHRIANVCIVSSTALYRVQIVTCSDDNDVRIW